MWHKWLDSCCLCGSVEGRALLPFPSKILGFNLLPAMDIPLDHLPRDQLAVLMSRIATILAQPHGPGAQQMPMQNNLSGGLWTNGSTGGRPCYMPTAVSWDLKDDPWNRHLLEGAAQPAAFGRACYWTTNSTNTGGLMQESAHCPVGDAGHLVATLPGPCKQSRVAGTTPTPLMLAEHSEMKHLPFASTCADFGAHTCSVQNEEHLGGGHAGDHNCSVRGSNVLVTGAAWLNKHEWSPSGTQAYDGALPGSSNDVQVCPRRDVVPACSSAKGNGHPADGELFEDCSANCRECNAKCCLRRRGHTKHKCLYHKFP